MKYFRSNIKNCMTSRVDETDALFPLSDIERSACEHLTQQSAHCKIKIFPNHCINEDSELEGFVFEAHKQDKAEILPLGKQMCSMTCLYELDGSDSSKDGVLNETALDIFNHQDLYRERMDMFIKEVQANTASPAMFDCIPVKEETTSFTKRIYDQRVFAESMPEHIGVYHAFSRNVCKTGRTHCLYIIVSGCLPHAAEEFYNLWLDARATVTVHDICESEELHWLRDATMRNHGRLAAKLAAHMNLQCKCVFDFSDPTQTCKMLIPTTHTMHYDARMLRNKNIGLVSKGCFVEHAYNGVLFDMRYFDGFTLYCGSTDNAQGNKYGKPLNSSKSIAFPTRCTEYHAKFPFPSNACTVKVGKRTFQIPDERFQQRLQNLGFDRDNVSLNLMPIITHSTN